MQVGQLGPKSTKTVENQKKTIPSPKFFRLRRAHYLPKNTAIPCTLWEPDPYRGHEDARRDELEKSHQDHRPAARQPRPRVDLYSGPPRASLRPGAVQVQVPSHSTDTAVPAWFPKAGGLSRLIVLSVPRGQGAHSSLRERPPVLRKPHTDGPLCALSRPSSLRVQSATHSTCAPVGMPLYLRSSPRKTCLSFPHEQMMGWQGREWRGWDGEFEQSGGRGGEGGEETRGAGPASGGNRPRSPSQRGRGACRPHAWCSHPRHRRSCAPVSMHQRQGGVTTG